MCNGKEAGSLRMSRKAAKESNAWVGAGVWDVNGWM